MRVGDLYKIRAMLSEGKSLDEICNFFKNYYSEDEIKSFLPAPKKKVAKKKAVKKEVEDTPEVEETPDLPETED